MVTRSGLRARLEQRVVRRLRHAQRLIAQHDDGIGLCSSKTLGLVMRTA